jgi:cytochrome c5
MKTHFLPVAAVCALIVGCATSKQAPLPTMAMATSSGKPLETLQRGHSVYLLKCSECHEAMMPDDVSNNDWHVVVPGMAWNAGITPQEEAAVLDYILAAKSR